MCVVRCSCFRFVACGLILLFVFAMGVEIVCCFLYVARCCAMCGVCCSSDVACDSWCVVCWLCVGGCGHCLLLGCSLRVADCLVCVVGSLLVVRCLLLVVCALLFARCVLRVVVLVCAACWCVLFVVCCSVFVVGCSSFVVGCLFCCSSLFWLLFVVECCLLCVGLLCVA